MVTLSGVNQGKIHSINLFVQKQVDLPWYSIVGYLFCIQLTKISIYLSTYLSIYLSICLIDSFWRALHLSTIGLFQAYFLFTKKQERK